MKNQFIPLAKSEQGFKIGEFMPTGKAWDSKNDVSTNLGALLLALGAEFNRIEDLIQTTNRELDINFTLELIREWELSVGIPDECFGIASSIELRRQQVITKLRNVRFQTTQDYVDLAALFGVTVTVFAGVPVAFPASPKEKRFSITINLPGTFQVFPFIGMFPIPFVGETSSFIQCLFEKLKPANVRLIFQFGVNQLLVTEITATTEVTVNTSVTSNFFDDLLGPLDDLPGLWDDL